MNKISLIIFTCNRALQLDLLLTSVFKNFKNLQKPIFIIHDFTKNHEKSYFLIKKKYKNKIKIIKVNTKKSIPFKKAGCYKKYFFRIINLIYNLRWKFFGFSDFKITLEKVLSNKVKSKFVTMMTDDTILFKKTKINELVFQEILKKPKNTFYRYCIDIKFKGLEEVKNNIKLNQINKKGEKIFKWKLKNNFFSTHNYFWNYRFAIDASIFEKKNLLNFIKPFFYSNPSNLESIGNKESYIRGYYDTGLSNLNRSYTGIHLNNIQRLIKTPAGSFDIEFLRYLFLNQYKILVSSKEINKKLHNIVPKDITLVKNKKKYYYSQLLNDFKRGKKI